jgi:site-specific recombinase XerC
VKVLKRTPRTLTWDQAAAVLAVCETTRARGLRDLAIISLMLESALRNAEVCRLELAKVDLIRHRLRVVVKGGKEEDGAFDALAAEYMAAWIVARREIARPDTKTLFCSVGGLTPGARLTPEGLRGIFRKIGREAGLSDGFSPHDLRRSCATLKTLLNAPTRTVQVGGRWSALREVETYTRSISLDDFERYRVVAHILERPSPPAETQC